MADVLIIGLILVGVVVALSFAGMMIAMAAMMLKDAGVANWVRERIEERRNDESWPSNDKDKHDN